MEPQTSNQYLELTYEQYLDQASSIAFSRLGKYIVFQRIKSGSFGTVYKGMDDHTKKEVAIKLIDLTAIQREQKNSKVREVRKRLAKTESQLVQILNSPHIIKQLDVYENEHLKIMVTQFSNQGTLSDIIYRKRKRIPEKQAIQILKQLILGIAQMHSNNIIHRDLKSDNVMCHNGIYKIIDLGFAKMLPSNSEIYQGTILGTIITMAPQVMNRQPYGVKADIWSLGVIFYEMIYGKLPFDPMKSLQMYNQIISKDIFPNNGRVNGFRPSDQVIKLMKRILVIDQDDRLSWQELITHKLFQINKSKLPQQYRITVDLANLKTISFSTILKNQIERLNELSLNQQKYQQKQNRKSIKISTLTLQQKTNKIHEIDKNSSKKILQQAKIYYVECLKTEYILEYIIYGIEEQSIFNVNDRQTVELLSLLANRCYFNMSNVKYILENKDDQVIKYLIALVQHLYDVVKNKFNQYGNKLTMIQDKVISIIGDRWNKIFSRSASKYKDIFLGGVEIQLTEHNLNDQKAGYTKQQQIHYAYSKYIKPMMQDKKRDNLLVRRLLAYQKINQISYEDIQKVKFQEIVGKIVG